MDAIAVAASLDRARAELAGLQQQVMTTQQQIADDRAAADRNAEQARQLVDDATAQLAIVRAQIVQTAETVLLQEVGVYEYRHPLSDAVAYKGRLSQLNDSIKSMTRGGTAVAAETAWTVRDSAREGRKMMREYSKLILRAYNAEADNCVRTMRPHRLTSSVDRLTKSRDTIARLGATMDMHFTENYHQLRVEELELTADYLAKVDEEKERIRAEREQRREEAAAQKEFDRERARLQKEHAHYLAALAKLETAGDASGSVDLQDKLEEIVNAIAGVEEREANVRAGYVYVISNLGPFGEHMIKIGMTRRLEPLDRVRELGDASVPFRFDIHALIFSDDAVSLEGELHTNLADRRVNQVNLRREFFYAKPAEVHEVLDQVVGPHLLEYTEHYEALEWRAGRRDRGQDERRFND